MKRRALACAVVALVSLAASARAQENYDAKWIWADTGNPAVEAPAGKVWFRHQVRSDGPSTGIARIVADDAFVLWMNGQKVGEGKGQQLYRFNLNGVVEEGRNVIAVEVANKDGKAGLFVDGEVRDQGGSRSPFDTGDQWRATQTAPVGDAWLKPEFDAGSWQAAKVIGSHADSPWKEIVLKDTYLDRYVVAQGFKIERIAEPELVGSLVAMTWGNRGRLMVSREKGPILSLIDENHDGKYEKIIEYSSAVTNCQGLCTVFDDLYANGDGPKGTGLYRLPDRNRDGVADEVQHVITYKGGMGDHGPHDVIYGPDGSLYSNLGNHSWVTQTPEPTTPVRDYYEGHLLDPRFEDAHGHAAGIKAPGGTIWRFTPDGKKWWLETAGFRNQYDFAFNSKGDMFSYDSDMEWDVGAPWYRPVRVNHCIHGAEFGWRSGTADWPEYRFDSLPGTVDTGRGSPTGVIFYEHVQFPEKYRGSFIVCDWSMGRIMNVRLKPEGATYVGEFETFVTGNPLNASDIEIDRDGSLVFCTGGRGTEGGVYRLSYPDGDKAVAKINFDDPFSIPQLQSGWARELVENARKKQNADWDRELMNAAWFGNADKKLRALTLMAQVGPKPGADLLLRSAQDDDATVRAFAVWLLGGHSGNAVASALSRALGDLNLTVRRRACEAFVRSGNEPPVEPLLNLLANEDRWLRFAARVALERVPVEKWRSRVVESDNPYVLTEGLLALFRRGKDAYPPEEALKREAAVIGDAFEKYDLAARLAVLRMIQLTLIAGGRGPVTGDIAEVLLKHFPTGDDAIDGESARILAALQHHQAAEKIVAALETAKSRERAIDYALTLRYINVGWNYELKRKLLDWYETTRDWEGGYSFTPFLANIVGATLERYQPEDRGKLLADWRTRPHAASLVIEKSSADNVADFEKIVASILNDRDAQIDAGRRDRLITVSLEALGKDASPTAQESLRKLFDAFPDRRDILARQLAQHPSEASWTHLVRSLTFGDSTTMQLAIRALHQVEKKPRNADDIRAVILAGLQLGTEGGKNAVTLLRELTGSDHGAGDDVAKALAYYQNWYHTTYPEAVAAVLPQQDLTQSKYSYEQLIDYLEGHGQQADVARGRQVFTKGKCVRCHRFVNEGEAVGPDLTTLRKRFQKKEIVESLVYPSQVISDQYRMVSVVTVDGLVHNGMPIPGPDNSDKLVLLLSDATKLEIPKDQVQEQARSKTSVMPVGILKELTLEEIADLFAFLETSKDNEAPPQPAAANKDKTVAGKK
ncbi:MAG: HEAT repeat domain-containing protein [Planctomycetaceae bacterium]